MQTMQGAGWQAHGLDAHLDALLLHARLLQAEARHVGSDKRWRNHHHRHVCGGKVGRLRSERRSAALGRRRCVFSGFVGGMGAASTIATVSEAPQTTIMFWWWGEIGGTPAPLKREKMF